MDFELYDIEELVAFSDDTIRLYGAYATIMINRDDMLKKLNKYLNHYQDVEECQHLGIEKSLISKRLARSLTNLERIIKSN